MTDGDLVRRALDGDAAAFDQLARRWAGRVLAVCHARIADRDLAEDLAQESLLRALQGLQSLQEPESFGPWIRGIAVHVCQDWRRSAAARTAALSFGGCNGDDQIPAAVDTPVGDDFETTDETCHVLDRVHALPQELREVILLYYYDDLTYDELARVLGVSKATVNARLAKARDALRRQLTSARK
jgi:RNA polymerase sigma-70 factor (ECF subfamily)